MADPNTPPIGRQPHNRAVEASRLADGYPWYGDIYDYEVVDGQQVGGQRWTREQRLTLAHLGMNPKTCDEKLIRRQSVGEEFVANLGSLPAVYEFPCPVVKTLPSGRIKVIAPNGCFKFVYPDGWGHRPFRRPRDEHDGYSQARIQGAGGARSRPSYSTTRKAIR